MKKLLFSLTLLGGMSLGLAQNVIYFEDFNESTLDNPPAGWAFEDMDGDGYNFGDMYFVPDAAGNPVTPISLISRSWQGSPLTPDNVATSPMIDLTNVSGTITLEWKVVAAAAAWDEENYSVYVSEIADPYEAILEEAVFTETYNDPGNAGAQYTRTVDLSSFAGSQVYISFRHHDVTDMDFLSIDDVTVTAEGGMGVADLTKSVSALYPNPVADVFQVNLSSKFDANNVKVTISDLTGKSVRTFGKADSYNVSDLAAGVYVVTITDGKTTETKKVVKK